MDVDAGKACDLQTPIFRYNLPFVNRLGGNAKNARRFREAAKLFDSFLTRDHPWIVGGKFQTVSHDLMLGPV
jgi:hypothetical protein